MARILIAEDDLHIAEMVRFKLAGAGHVVLHAPDGGAAVELSFAELPDLVLLDVMMPVLGGFEVLQKLKADERTRAIPVVLLTARGRERDVLAGLAAGAADYVVKPFSPRELLARIENAVRSRPPSGAGTPR
jgi:DNA-binding response OmpR family regulator